MGTHISANIKFSRIIGDDDAIFGLIARSLYLSRISGALAPVFLKTGT